MSTIVAGALQQRNFQFLLGGQFVSDFGRQLTIFALPTIAILTLHASTRTVAALAASEYAVVPALAMACGVLVDHYDRRRIMILANAVRFAALAALPILSASHRLSVPALAVSAMLVSLASLFFDTAYQPFLRTLLGRERYPRGNARMTVSAQAAAALGNAAGGPLVQMLGAPLAIASNLLTYIVGTIALLRIRTEPAGACARLQFRKDFIEGCRVVWREPVLRVLAISTAAFYFGGTIADTALPLYAYRHAHLTALEFGSVLAVSSLTVPFASRAARRGMRRPPLILGAALLAACAGHLLCAVPIVPMVAIVTGRAIVAFSAPVYGIIVQTLATDRMHERSIARANATLRTFTNLAIPFGCLTAGTIGAHWSLQIAMAAGGAIVGAAALVPVLCLRVGTAHACSHATAQNSPLPLAA